MSFSNDLSKWNVPGQRHCCECKVQSMPPSTRRDKQARPWNFYEYEFCRIAGPLNKTYESIYQFVLHEKWTYLNEKMTSDSSKVPKDTIDRYTLMLAIILLFADDELVTFLKCWQIFLVLFSIWNNHLWLGIICYQIQTFWIVCFFSPSGEVITSFECMSRYRSWIGLKLKSLKV